MKPWGLLLLLAIVLAAAIVSGFWLLYRLAYVIGLALILGYAWAFANVYGAKVERSTRTNRTQVGSPIEEQLTVENLLPVPKLWLEVADQSNLPGHQASAILTLGGRRSHSWTTKTVARRRGLFRLGPISLRSSDPFGLFVHERVIDQTHDLVVYPAIMELSNFEIPLGELAGESRIQRRTQQVTPSASGIREWQRGDSFNRIHWRSTARAGRLMVKEFDLDPTSDIWLVLDLEQRVQAGAGEESTEEYAVTATASLAKRFLDRNRSVGLVAFGQPHELVHADRGGRQLTKMLETLAIVRALGAMPLAEVLLAESPRFTRNSTVVVVTPSTSEDWLAVLRDLARRGARSTVVLVEPTTFGGPGEPILVVSSLAANRIPVYLVKQGEPLDRSLSAAPVLFDGQSRERKWR